MSGRPTQLAAAAARSIARRLPMRLRAPAASLLRRLRPETPGRVEAMEAAIHELAQRTAHLRAQIEALRRETARLAAALDEQKPAAERMPGLEVEVANLRNLAEWTHGRLGELSIETGNRFNAVEVEMAALSTPRQEAAATTPPGKGQDRAEAA